ncbi:MAG: hypothetical protein NT131_02715 [Methanomassiliicoccales archaeon]|nr:hypothetical protein [Methanomassiliicoccales archaeon]
MFKYEYKINWSGQITSGTIECENNEDSKRTTMKRLKEIGIPVGKYVFVDIVRLDDNKEIVTDELWKA